MDKQQCSQNLRVIQERFKEATEKDYWGRLKTLLFAEDKENVVLGMNILKRLNEDVYLDGLSTFFEFNIKNQKLKIRTDLPIKNQQALLVEVIRLADSKRYQHHELHSMFLKEGFFDAFLWDLHAIKKSKYSISPLISSRILHICLVDN